MTDTPAMGHNRPPVSSPADADVKTDLETRYPEVKKELDEMDAALATMPSIIADDETARALTDNLGKIGKLRKSWKAYRADEKKPWNTVIGIIQNFFVTGEDRLEKMDEKWRPILKEWQDKKEAEAVAARQAEIERQRAESERLRFEAEDRNMDALWAEARKELAEYDEAKARERLEKQEADRRAAEARAETERLRQKEIEDARKKADREERDRNAESLKSIRRHMKDAEKLHALAEADEANEDEIAQLDTIIKPGGMVSGLAGPVNSSLLLDDDQKPELDGIKTRLGEIRSAFEERSNKRERAKREKARLKEEAEAKERAEDRMWADAREDLRLHDQRKARESADAEVEKAKLAEKATKGEISDHRAAHRDAHAGAREAGKAARGAEEQADRTENRVDRLQKKADNATGDGQQRGDYSALSSQTGRWTANIMDEKALRLVCGPLGEHFTETALQGAVSQWMVAHRDGFEGERATDPALPGVVFIWERSIAIRA